MPSFICACVYWEFLRDSKLPPLVQKKRNLILLMTTIPDIVKYCDFIIDWSFIAHSTKFLCY